MSSLVPTYYLSNIKEFTDLHFDVSRLNVNLLGSVKEAGTNLGIKDNTLNNS